MGTGRFTYSIRTMGCKANIYDSLILERELTALGGTRDERKPDVFVLNTCTVTNEADRQAHRDVSALRKRAPEAWTVVTGCYAQVAPERLGGDANVSVVVGNDGKGGIKRLVAAKFGISLEESSDSGISSELGADVYWGQLPTMAGRTRAFLKIQEGCNDFCTYCIIPYARGKSRSVRTGPLLAEIRRLTKAGVREVVLTGTNIADYGRELGTCLEDLIEGILEKTDIPRLRLTSLDPSEISDRILALMGEGSRLMPHFHVSLQSPVSRVLRAMKRDYRQEEAVEALNRIHARNSGIFVGMDVIAGFPTETDAEHRAGVALLERLPWTRLHVFPYSEREGTPATRLPGVVPPSVRKERARELLDLSRKRHEEFAQRHVGSTLKSVLFESRHEAGGDHFVVGHSENYLRVMARMPSRTAEEGEAWINRVGDVRVISAVPRPAEDWTLESVISP